MRVLRLIVQAVVLSVLYAFEHLVFGSFVALEFVAHDHPWHKALLLEKLAEKALGDLGISMRLHQNIEHVAFGIYRSPQIILFAFDGDNDFIEMPLICWIRRLRRT